MESVDKPVRSPCLETHSKKKSFSISCPCPVVFFFVFRLPDKRQEVNISSLVTLLSYFRSSFFRNTPTRGRNPSRPSLCFPWVIQQQFADLRLLSTGSTWWDRYMAIFLSGFIRSHKQLPNSVCLDPR